MMRTILTILLLSVFPGVFVCGEVSGQAYNVKWYSINSGGSALTSSSYTLNMSVGQNATGLDTGGSFLHWVGFWSGELPVPIAKHNISDIKLLADGSYVSIAGMVATSGASDFNGFFYFEEPDRSSGIRVTAPFLQDVDLTRGSIVNVIGQMGTTPSGERQLIGPLVMVIGTQSPLEPVGLNNRDIGGGDAGLPPQGQYGVTGAFGLNNIGLLVKTWGRIADKGTNYVILDDGSGQFVRIDTSLLVAPPDVNDYVIVIGVSSLFTSGPDRIRFVLTRDDGDIGSL